MRGVLVLLALLTVQPVSAFVFRFKHGGRRSIQETSLLRQQLFRDGKRLAGGNLKTVLVARLEPATQGATRYRCSMEFFGKNGGKENWQRRARRSFSFIRHPDGKTVAPPGLVFLPRLDFPRFPVGDVPPRHGWQRAAQEVVNLRPFNIPFEQRLPVRVSYTYSGDGIRAGRSCARISYSYEIKSRRLSIAAMRSTVLITGTVQGTLYWEKARNLPRALQEKYELILFFGNGHTLQVRGVVDKSWHIR